MPELVGLGVLVLLVGAALLLLHRSDRVVDDEPPTLDTRNHVDDP